MFGKYIIQKCHLLVYEMFAVIGLQSRLCELSSASDPFNVHAIIQYCKGYVRVNSIYAY